MQTHYPKSPLTVEQRGSGRRRGGVQPDGNAKRYNQVDDADYQAGDRANDPHREFCLRSCLLLDFRHATKHKERDRANERAA